MLAPNLPLNLSDRLPAVFSEDLFEAPLRESFERIIRLARNLFEVPIAAVSFLDEGSKLFKSLLGSEVLETMREDSFCEHVLNHKDVFNVPETFLDERFCNNPYVVSDPFVRFYAGYPIRFNHVQMGTFFIVDNKPRHFNAQQLDWIKDMSALVETEIQKYNMATDKGKLSSDLDQARMASMVDPLTSLWNRQGIYNILKYRMEEYLAKGTPFSVAVLDIDDFKKINDSYGHESGDHTLKAISQCLIKGCRETDGIGRWGGEEFLLLINETNSKYALEIAERIRTTIECQEIALPSHISKKVTVTIGITSIDPGTTPSLEDLINKADQALYQGKRGGRNQVVLV
jgi:diguanylate cyclase (GGDEF)-like protein